MAKQEIPPGYVKAEAIGTYGPASWANVMYFDATPSDPTHPEDVATAVANTLHAFYSGLPLSRIQTAWLVNTYKVFYRADPTSAYSFTLADAIGGANVGEGQDAQVSYLINWTSGDARKGGKPRQYICGVSNSERADTARLTNACTAAFNTAITTWLASFPHVSGTAHVIDLVEMSFVSNKVDLAPPVARTVRAGHLNPIVASQRRRVDRLRI